MKAGILSEPVLVGRERELEELMCCLDSVFEGKGKTIFISGEAGSGKTRLTSEFLKSAKERGATILTGWCLNDVAIPYFPFIEAFRVFFSATKCEATENVENELNAWLAGAGQDERAAGQRTMTPQARRDIGFATVNKALLSISTEKPVALFIEDLQWADSASLSLLHYLARTTSAEKVFILATFRSEELTANVEGYPHPLAEMLRLMRREELHAEINISKLGDYQIAKIAENMLGGTISPGLAAKLSEESHGNALYVVESLRMLFERGSLHQESDQWRLSVDALGIPAKLKDIILRRLSVLRFAQRRILDAASVIGEKFDADLLSTVLGQDNLEVLEALSMIAQSTSLICIEANHYRFDHARSREAIYEEIPLPLKSGYHVRVAEKLETRGKCGQLRFSDIAFHFAQAGDKERAVKYALEAGKVALQRFSNAEAIKHFAYVVRTIPDSAEGAETKRTALEGLGDAYHANGMFEEAIKTFERLANSENGPLKLRALRKAMDVAFRQRNSARLTELLRIAEGCKGIDRLENARVQAHKARAWALIPGKGNMELSLKDTEEAIRVFEEEYSVLDVAIALVGISATCMQLGMPERTFFASQRSIALLEEIGDLHELSEALAYGGSSFMVWGLYQEALSGLAKAFEIGEKIGNYARMANACSGMGTVFEILGRIEEAISKNLTGLEYSKKTDATHVQMNFCADLTRLYARIGDMKRAEECFRTLMDFPSELRSSRLDRSFIFRRKFYTALAVFYAAENEWSEASQYFEKAFKSAEATDAPSALINTRMTYAWALNKQGRAKEASAQLEFVQEILKEVENRFAHVNLNGNLMVPKHVTAGEEFEMRLDLFNVSRKRGVLVKIESLIPREFIVVAPPVNGTLENGAIELGEKGIGAFQLEAFKLRLKGTKAGAFTLNPQVTYLNESGEVKTLESNSCSVAVQPSQPKYEVFPGRITTGYDELDALLLGGIPEKYTVVLSSPSIDERALIVKKFLEAGTKSGEPTFYVATEVGSAKSMAEADPSSFFLAICNPQADAIVASLPNVFKLKGIESLTEVDIALTKAFRALPATPDYPRRICIEVISDVLLEHHALVTRKWLSGLLPNLKSKGFTVLAVINPQMHPPEEVQAVLSLFDGEIRVTERETAKGAEKVLSIRKLSGQRYLDSELVLNREKPGK